MPELRKDPITRRWVIIATERSKRPSDFVQVAEAPDDVSSCPFCEGHEDMTPQEVLAYRAVDSRENGPGWITRVIPDKDPLLKSDIGLGRWGLGMYDIMSPFGVHEIVIEAPEHATDLCQMSDVEVEQVLWAYKERIEALRKKNKDIYHFMVVKNYGKEAGATFKQNHPHSHLIGFPVIPKRVADEIKGASLYFQYRERCLFCDILRQELQQGVRIISENRFFIAYAPFASRFPFEIAIIPKNHSAHFEEIEKEAMVNLASILKNSVMRIFAALKSPAYNYIIHMSPYDCKIEEYYHWHIEIMPRVTKMAGFEWGSGFYINPTPPEIAAKFLREVKL